MELWKWLMKTCAGALVFLFFMGSSVVWAGAPDAGEQSMSHHMNMLVLQLSVILVAAWFGGRFFKRMKFPPVLGELVSGVLIGPYALGGFALPGLPYGLFPLHGGDFPVSLELYSIATIASIILLFLAGLETDLETFLRFSFVGSVVGFFGVVFSFMAGDFVGMMLMCQIYGVEAGFFHAVPLFLGVISTATSVGISARILSDKRRLNAPEGVTILAAAVIDDVLGIIILAVIIGMAKTHTIGIREVALISFKAIGMWLVFTFMGIRYAGEIGGLLKKISDRSMIAIIALALALLVAGIFEKSGLAMIIGAYVMGLSLSKTDLSFLIQEKLDSVQRLLVPVFFCVMGMLINLRVISTPLIIKFGIIYILAAVGGKIVGCSLPSLFLNFNSRGAMRIGVGMIPRGEVALIIAGIGLSMGIIDDRVFSLAIMMTFVTTLFTPPLFDRMLSVDRPVLRRKMDQEKDQTSLCFKMPNAETATLLLSLLIPAFEEEGFYTHCLEGEEKLYHIRKDATFITLRYRKHDFIFDCAKTDVTFVNTVFYEVIADVECFMQRLQELTDKRDIGKNIMKSGFGARAGRRSTHSIYDYISPMAVETRLKGRTKDEILREMIGLLVRANAFSEETAQKIFHELIERERLMSTGMQDGVALPHVKTSLVEHIRFAVGVAPEPVDFDSLDRKPSQIFVLAVAPRKGHESYLQYLAEISKFLSSEENRRRMLTVEQNQALFQLLEEEL